jgi:predicted RNA-binding protein Jag
MNEEAILRQINNMDSADVEKHLEVVSSMQRALYAVKEAEMKVHSESLKSSTLIFPEDFNSEMRGLNSNLRAYTKLLERVDTILTALRKQQVRLRKK